jgi:uncharacterized membrane protein YsdA (DUF1294 family)
MTWTVVAMAAGGVYGLVSLVTFVVYALDKRAAQRGRRRVPEATLHTLELLGGWPGALLGQRVLRHKTRDVRFLVVFWGVVLLHAAAWGLAAWLSLRG